MKKVEGYNEGLHGLCKFVMGCCTCLPAVLGLILIFVIEEIGGIAELLRCLCWAPSFFAHVYAEGAISGSKKALTGFSGLGNPEKVTAAQTWLTYRATVK